MEYINVITDALTGEVTEVPMTADEIAQLEASRNTVPQSVTMRQARIALLQQGLLSTVNSTIANMQGEMGDAARIEWEFSSEVQRNKPIVLAMQPLLNLTDEQLDNLFILASKL